MDVADQTSREGGQRKLERTVGEIYKLFNEADTVTWKRES